MSTILPIVIYPNKILRTPTIELDRETIESAVTQQLIDDMIATMYNADGVGLAAPQIGQLLQITVIDPQDESGLKVLINPKIVKTSYRNERMEEGCLSLPGVGAVVKRSRLVTVAYQDRTGATQVLQAHPFLSRVIQHELDHLNGVLFIDHTDALRVGQSVLKQWDEGLQPLLSIAYPYTYSIANTIS